jgi:hypothetical protein
MRRRHPIDGDGGHVLDCLPVKPSFLAGLAGTFRKRGGLLAASGKRKHGCIRLRIGASVKR